MDDRVESMTINWRLTVFTLALLLPVLALPGLGIAAAQDEAGTFIPSACMFEGLDLGLTTVSGETLGFECGYVVVPERHADPDGRTIRLPVAIRRATAPEARPDPLLLAQGGPGGDAFEVFSLLTPNTEIAAQRDIVIFNQRGTPYAEPELICQETEEVLPDMLAATDEEAERLYNEALEACHARLLGEGIDLSAYNSLENAADIPLIARALGYDEYNFYGVSYGTLLGLHLMRNHPEGLRAVVLDSVVSTDINFLSETPQSEDRVLAEVFAACLANPECAELYPNLEERYYALVRQFNENPVTLNLTDPETGERHEATLDGVGLRAIIFQLLYLPGMNAILPKVIADLEQGDLRYLEGMWPLFIFDQLVAEGMYYSVICAEDGDIDVTDIPVETLRPEIAETARQDLESYVASCARWHVEQLPAAVDDPVSSDIPTLLLSGRFDPVTPPAFAQAAAAGLSNAHVLVDPLASHGVAFFNPCVNTILNDFLNDPTQPPDSSCLAAQESPRVVPPDAITLPLLAGVNSLEPRTLAVFGVAALLLLVVLSPFIVWPIVYIIRAFGERQPARLPEDRRWRLLGRTAVLIFGVVALVFTIGLTGFIVASLFDPVMLTALALPSSAAPILWLPILLLLLAIGIIATLFVLWRRQGTGSTAGKVYHTLVAIAAVVLVVVLGAQSLLLPPL
jgi:pimeloyl-ACP methyl ester carboxylesterase